MAFHDLLTDPQAESVSRRSLGGEKRIENLLPHRRVDATAVVGNGQLNATPAGLPIGALAAADQQAPTERHGLKGISHQVVQHLAHVALKADNRPVGAKSLLHTYMSVVKPSLVDAHHGRKQIGSRSSLRFRSLLVEAQRLVGDDRDAANLLVRKVEIPF